MANRIAVLAAAATLLVAAIISAACLSVRTRRGDHSPESPVLNTANVLWTHQEGTICLQGRTFQSLTVSPEEPDVVVVQEVIDGFMHTYEMVNTDELYKEDRKDLSWIDTLVGVKYNCQVSPIDNDDFDASEPTLLRRHDDGSTSWAVAHWTVEAGADLVPRLLYSPDDPGTDTAFEMIIDNVTDCGAVLVVGCDPATEAGDDHLPSVTNMTEGMLEDALRAHGHDVDGDGARRLIHRLLQQQFVPEITRTNWCGPRTPKDTSPCPDDSLEASISNYDKQADIACRRHDHGVKFTVNAGAGNLPRTECMNDRDLVYASDNWALEAVYGWGGVAGAWGCYSYGPYKCWKGWRYGNYCCGEKVRYGWTRYNNIARYDGWGYYPPDESKGEQFCDNDLWECVGNDCTALTPRAPETAKQCA